MTRSARLLSCALLALSMVAPAGCGGSGSPGTDGGPSPGDDGGGPGIDADPNRPDGGVAGVAVEVTPAIAAVAPLAQQAFAATVTGTDDPSVTWSVDEAGGGAVAGDGSYTAPAAEGTYHVRATSVADPAVSAAATVRVAVPADVAPFFAPPVPSGEIAVKLYPTEVVSTGAPTLVTFGVPFPRGSLAPADLATVRVLSGGAEVPAHVALLAPWRHLSNPAIDGASVRVARVQIRHTFSAPAPAFEVITVAWGGEPRAADVAALVDPRSAWHQVDDDTFPAAYDVDEPDVYAVLPAAWLAQGLFTPTRMDPFDASVEEARSDPTATDAIEHWPGYTEEQHAAKNFFYTLIGQDDPLVTAENSCPYLDESEPWLYDRASAIFRLYFRSGFPIALRQAVRSAEFYRDRLYPPGTVPSDAVGVFRLKAPDPAEYIGANGAMYSYAENLAYAGWVTGDDESLASIRWVVQAHAAQIDGEPTRWNPDASGWTERHTAFRLLAYVVAYEALGDEAYADTVRGYVDDFIWHQDGAGGLVPADHIDGGLWHLMSQHEGEDGPYMASPWMTALTVDAMVRAYAAGEDPRIAEFVRRIGLFEQEGTERTDPFEYEYEEGDGLLRLVDYITFIDGSFYEPEGQTGEHALEVAATVAWASYFAALQGSPDAALRQTAEELYLTYDVAVNYWTRPTAPAEAGLPAYRLQVGVCRKYVWQHRPAASLSWSLNAH